MRYLKVLAAVIFLAMSVGAKADNDQEDFNNHGDGAPHVDVWTNKGYDASYYLGEDVAVFFQADQDCYVVVYDVDPSGDINVIFPNTMTGSTSVNGGQLYRIPDTNDDFKMEVSGSSGTEHIYAVASFDLMNPPDFMKYINYDYGSDQNYSSDYFVAHVSGNEDDFADSINDRIASGPYSVAHTRFLVDTSYRHHEHYRYSDYGPYDVGSVWVGADWPGCEVWIDGCYWGIAPILVPQVIVGYHWVWIYYGGYPCYQRYFYVPGHRRFNIDARIDDHFKDYRYRRDHFRGWVFDGKRYRNEPGFNDRARQLEEKNIRVRSLPPSVIRDYSDRGIIKQDSPLAKQIRNDTPDRGYRGKAELPNQPGTNNPGSVKIDNGDKNIRSRGTTVIEKPTRPNNEGPKTIVPGNPRVPEKVNPGESQPQSHRGRLIEKHESNFRGSDRGQTEKIYQPQQSGNQQPERVNGPQERTKYSQPEKSQPQRESSGGNVERQKSANDGGNHGNSGRESRSSGGNGGKAARGR